MKVIVHMLYQSRPIVHENVKNTYQKGSMYCVMHTTENVFKYPIEHIFRVKEEP
jgi:hypothetical protein